MIDFKKELNKAQYEVVTAPKGPALVLAGAGSGKTRTLVYRVAYLLEQGVLPERILLLTFTNKAAHEMLSRVAELIQRSEKTKKTEPRTVHDRKVGTGTGVWGGTFHHVAHRLLRKMGSAVGLKSNFTILDREDSKDALKRILKEFLQQMHGKRLPQPGIVLEVISYAANAQVPLAEAIEKKYPDGARILPVLEAVALRYEERKRRSNALDFDDLLKYWLALLKKPALLKKLSGLWEYILVDEYQDTNTVQDEIVRLLASAHHNLLVVGDDAQSIYSFRAANIENILQFPKNFPEAKTYKLEENYRSSPEILDVANNIIEKNTAQFQKKLFTGQENFIKPELLIAQDSEEEAGMIADRIGAIENESVPLDRIAVLFRAAHQSQSLELELNKRSIPYEMRGGLRFFERAHIKDMLAYMRLLANPADEQAWFRVLSLHEGIGDVTAEKIIGAAAGKTEWKQIVTLEPPLSTTAQKGWRDFGKTMRSALAESDMAPGAMLRAVKPHYREYLTLQFSDFRDRLDDLEQLALFADRYDDLDTFVAETSLQEAFALRGSGGHSKEPAVVLSTIHQAKGLEWNTVFVLQLTGASLPHPKAAMEEGGLEEERRLFYVAVTRAQRRLYLSYPLSSSRFSISLNQPSQFLRELDQKLIVGKLENNDEERYIDVDDDTERGFLPSIDKL